MLGTVTKISLALIPALLFGMVVFFPATTSAQASSACPGSDGLLGFPTWYEYLDTNSNCDVSPIRHEADPIRPDEKAPINLGATIGAILLAVIEILLRVAGIVAVGYVVYGGILYMTSQGTPDKLQAAQKTILHGLIGLIIAAFAVAIVNLFSNVVTASSRNTQNIAQQTSNRAVKDTGLALWR